MTFKKGILLADEPNLKEIGAICLVLNISAPFHKIIRFYDPKPWAGWTNFRTQTDDYVSKHYLYLIILD